MYWKLYALSLNLGLSSYKISILFICKKILFYDLTFNTDYQTKKGFKVYRLFFYLLFFKNHLIIFLKKPTKVYKRKSNVVLKNAFSILQLQKLLILFNIHQSIVFKSSILYFKYFSTCKISKITMKFTANIVFIYASSHITFSTNFF